MIIIERFEGNRAILEDSSADTLTEVARSQLPASAREGDIVELQGGSYVVNDKATSARRQKVIDRLRQMGL